MNGPGFSQQVGERSRMPARAREAIPSSERRFGKRPRGPQLSGDVIVK